MAKVKICLDSACTKYIYCEDGTTVIQKKSGCDANFKPDKNFDKDFDTIARETRKTLFDSDQVFENPEIGKELVMKSNDDAVEIAALEKRLKELKVKKKIESGT